MQPIDLLRQRYLEQVVFDLGSSCRHSANKIGMREGVMPADSAMRN